MCACTSMLIQHRILLLMRFTYRAKVSTLDHSGTKVNSRAPFRLELIFISLIASLLGTLSLKISRLFLHPQGKVGKGWKRAGHSEKVSEQLAEELPHCPVSCTAGFFSLGLEFCVAFSTEWLGPFSF